MSGGRRGLLRQVTTSRVTVVAVWLAVLLPLIWDAPEPTGAALRYRIYKTTTLAGPWSLLKTVRTTSTRVEVPIPGVAYFRVRAVDELNQVSPDSKWLNYDLRVTVEE